MKKILLPATEECLAGRATPLKVETIHAVNGNSIVPPFQPHLQQAMFGLGCFWGAERKFWLLNGVHATAVGYSGGKTPNPTYEEVCSGLTGHNEVVLVVYDPATISFTMLLRTFFESHNPTQYMRQGNDVGTQYRSGIYAYDDQQEKEAEQAKELYQLELKQHGFGNIETEIVLATEFYYAETYHQQYLHKNPNGYCGLGGTGVACSI